MDFKLVFKKLLDAFEKENISYALIGGFALGLWGVGRATVDIDFIIGHNDIKKVERIMTESGYKCEYRTKNVSQFVSPSKTFGEVDFLHAFREMSLEIIKRAEEKEIFDGNFKIMVAKPEDIIGLKLQAIKNDPLRQQAESEDIKSLVNIHESTLDWSLIEEYARILEMENFYKELRKKK